MWWICVVEVQNLYGLQAVFQFHRASDKQCRSQIAIQRYTRHFRSVSLWIVLAPFSFIGMTIIFGERDYEKRMRLRYASVQYAGYRFGLFIQRYPSEELLRDFMLCL